LEEHIEPLKSGAAVQYTLVQTDKMSSVSYCCFNLLLEEPKSRKAIKKSTNSSSAQRSLIIFVCAYRVDNLPRFQVSSTIEHGIK